MFFLSNDAQNRFGGLFYLTIICLVLVTYVQVRDGSLESCEVLDKASAVCSPQAADQDPCLKLMDPVLFGEVRALLFR